MGQTHRVRKLRKQEEKRIKDVQSFWDEHCDKSIGLIYPQYFEEYMRMRHGLIDLHQLITKLKSSEL